MFKIFYSSKSQKSLKNFINSYKSSFISMIKDSGLEVEDYLIENYIQIGDKLYENIILEIQKTFKEDVLIGRHENSEKYLVVNINSFKIFLYYDDNIDFKERYIIDIKFYKK